MKEEIKNVPAAPPENFRYKSKEHYAFGWTDPRATYGTDPTKISYRLKVWYRDKLVPGIRRRWRKLFPPDGV